MLNWQLFRPYNVAVIAVAVLFWMFAFSKVKTSLDGRATGPE